MAFKLLMGKLACCGIWLPLAYSAAQAPIAVGQDANVAIDASTILAVQFPWYWEPTAMDAKARCLDMVSSFTSKQPSLLKPFNIVVLRIPAGKADIAARERIEGACPGAMILTSSPVVGLSVSIAIPTNRIIFTTFKALNMDQLKQLLPPSAVLVSTTQDRDCCTYSADIHNGPATEAIRIANDLKKSESIKHAQVNIVHLTIDSSAFNRN